MLRRSTPFAAALWLALLVSVVLAAPVPAPAGLSKPEKEALRIVAKEWITLGKTAVGKKLGKQAKGCADLAKAADDSAEGYKAFRDSADACEDAAADADAQAYEKTATAAKKKIAGIYEKLYHLMPEKETDVKVQERYEGYLFDAVELDANPQRWGVVATLASQAVTAKAMERAARIAGRAISLSPPAGLVPAFKKTLDDAAVDGMILRTDSAHPMKYYLSLPRGFARKKDKKWAVLIAVDGAGSNFKGIAEAYRGARASLPFIIASPCTFANTNTIEGDMKKKYETFYTDAVIDDGNQRRIAWDEEGILAMIKDLQAEYDAEERVYITGFSGGGNATYMMTFKHPDLLNGSAPSCGNFANFGYSDLKGKFTPEDLNFPVHQITGEKDEHGQFTFGKKDSPGIEPQTDGAAQLLTDFGYANVKRTKVPGMGHDTGVVHVIGTFKPYWEGTKKRGDKQG